mgnify:CR=1 FL=1
MYFELYVDSLFLLNLTLNSCVLYLTDRKLGGIATLGRMIFGSVLGTFLSILPLFSEMTFREALILGFTAEIPAMILGTFRAGSVKGFFRILGTLAEYELLMGGILLLFFRLFPKLASFVQSTLTMSVMMIAMSVLFVILKQKERKEMFCEVILCCGEREKSLSALIDSGNSLTDPISHKPVTVIRKSLLLELYEGEEPEYYRAIPYRSVGKAHGILKGYFLPRMIVFKNGIRWDFENVCIGVWEEEQGVTIDADGEGGAELLLNPQLFTDRCGINNRKSTKFNKMCQINGRKEKL